MECEIEGTLPEVLERTANTGVGDRIREYHRLRVEAYAGNIEKAYRIELTYKFYIMERVAAVVFPAKKRYVQTAATMDLDEMELLPLPKISSVYQDAILGAIDSIQREGALTTVVTAKEGRSVEYYTTKYERNPANRRCAIAIHGAKCQACGFDFEEVYGELGRGFIEVHHVRPLHSLDGEVEVDPETDLVCLCSNCHRMVHRKRGEVLSVKELASLIAKAGNE